MHSNVCTVMCTHSFAVRQKMEQSCFRVHSCNVTSLQYDIVLLLLLMGRVWWEVNMLDILSLCGCPTKLLLQHGSFVCAVIVTSYTCSKCLSLFTFCAHLL